MKSSLRFMVALLASCGTTPFTALDGGGDAAADGPADAIASDVRDDGQAPTDVPGVVLWLNGSMGLVATNGRVTRWLDQSGNQNDAHPPMCGTCGAQNQPEVDMAAINNRPGVRFKIDQPYQLVVDDTATMQWGTGEFLVEIVAKFQNGTDAASGSLAGFLFKGAISQSLAFGIFGNSYTGSLSSPMVTPGAVAMFDFTHVASVTTPLNNGKGQVFGMRRGGASFELRINGNAVASTTAMNVDVSLPGLPIRIGALFDGGSFRVDGSIAEIIAVRGPGALTGTPLIEGYLKTKYGL